MKTAILLATAFLIGSTVLAQEPSDDEIDFDDDARDEFGLLDRDQDGKLTRAEFNDAVFGEIDLDHDGGISVEEGQKFLLIHGTKDQPESLRLHAELLKVGVESVLIPIAGGEHGNFEKSHVFPEVAERIRQFFDKHLLGKDVVVSAEPIKPKKRP